MPNEIGLKRLCFDLPLVDAISLVKSRRAPSEIPVRSLIRCENYTFCVIGHNHDVRADSPFSPTMTVIGTKVAGMRRFHISSCHDGWSGSEIREWLNSEFFDLLPPSLRIAIHPAKRKTYDCDGVAHETEDKLFIPTESEMFGSAMFSARMDGERYEAFETAEDRVVLDEDGDKTWYWLASPQGGSSANFCDCSYYGVAGNGSASDACGVPLCFIIS